MENSCFVEWGVRPSSSSTSIAPSSWHDYVLLSIAIRHSLQVYSQVTKLNTIPDSSLSITCAVCQHNAVLEVANLLLVVDEDATAHDVRRRYTCPKCKTVGNNTYKIV